MFVENNEPKILKKSRQQVADARTMSNRDPALTMYPRSPGQQRQHLPTSRFVTRLTMGVFFLMAAAALVPVVYALIWLSNSGDRAITECVETAKADIASHGDSPAVTAALERVELIDLNMTHTQKKCDEANWIVIQLAAELAG